VLYRAPGETSWSRLGGGSLPVTTAMDLHLGPDGNAARVFGPVEVDLDGVRDAGAVVHGRIPRVRRAHVHRRPVLQKHAQSWLVLLSSPPFESCSTLSFVRVGRDAVVRAVVAGEHVGARLDDKRAAGGGGCPGAAVARLPAALPAEPRR